MSEWVGGCGGRMYLYVREYSSEWVGGSVV